MTPEYLEELADMADPQQLWRTPALAQRELPPHLRAQLDAGVALRRHADHVRRLRALLGSGESLLITPLSINGTDMRTVPMPAEIRQRLERESDTRAASLDLGEASEPF